MRRLFALSAVLGLVVAAFASAAAPPATPRFITALRAGRPQHVVIYGTCLSNSGAWVPRLQATLDDRFPGLVKLTNSARGGQHAGGGATPVDSAVVALKPDVVFIEFAINDAVTRFDLSLDTVRRNVDTILDRIATALPGGEGILQIMNPAFGQAAGESAHRRKQDAYQQIYRDAAQRRGLLLVDHSLTWNHLLATAGEPAVKQLIPDGVHPNVEGCVASSPRHSTAPSTSTLPRLPDGLLPLHLAQPPQAASRCRNSRGPRSSSRFLFHRPPA